MYDLNIEYEEMLGSRLYAMGGLRLVGSLKWFVSFAEYHLFNGALLQKRLIIWRSLLIIATPYESYVTADRRRFGTQWRRGIKLTIDLR